MARKDDSDYRRRQEAIFRLQILVIVVLVTVIVLILVTHNPFTPSG